MTAGRQPPHDLEAEAALLGALLVMPANVADPAVETLEPEHFYKPQHQHIYTAIRELAATNGALDTVLVANELERRGVLEEIGGWERLHTLQNNTSARMSNAAHYAEIIRTTAARREVIAIAAELIDSAYTRADPAHIAAATARLERLSTVDHHGTDRDGGALPAPVDWSELFNQDRASADWLVDDLWPSGRMISLTAPRKERKSLLMLYLAARLAAGHDPWTGRHRDPIDVIYLDHEMTEADLLERIQDMGHDADTLGRLHYFLHPAMPMLDQPEGGKVLLAMIDRYQAGAVIIDTFSRVVASRDFSGHEVREFYRWSAGHVKARGVGLARLDHTGHNNPDRPAGTFAKLADVDVGWMLKPGEAGSLTLRHGGLTRLAWVPERLALTMRTDPLAFGRANRVWLPGTIDCAAELDALGAPLDISGNAAQQLLKAVGKGRNRQIVQHAVAWRKEPEVVPEPPL